MQVREIDPIRVAERERAHARRCEKLRDRRAESADADDQRTRGGESGLRIRPELVEEDVPAVAEELRSSTSCTGRQISTKARRRCRALLLPTTIRYCVFACADSAFIESMTGKPFR